MDDLIIDKIKQHDESGIILLKKTYLPLILYILHSFPLNHQDHEECINDIMLKVWNSIDQYNYQLSLKNYIALITRRVALNYVRKKNQYPLSYEDMDIFASDDQYEKIPWDHILRKLNHKEAVTK